MGREIWSLRGKFRMKCWSLFPPAQLRVARLWKPAAAFPTLTFTLAGSNHTCVTPSENEATRIKEFCDQNGIDRSKLSFELGPSEQVLPALEDDGFDIVLIDGRHAFPTPFIDWYYLNDKIRVGGLVLVDDVQVWTGTILRDFLLAEPEWVLEKDFRKTCVLKKVANGSNQKWFAEQPYVARLSRWPLARTKLLRGVDLIRKGQIGTLIGLITKKDTGTSRLD